MASSAAMEPMAHSILNGHADDDDEGLLLMEDDSMHASENDGSSMEYDDFPLEEFKEGAEQMQQQPQRDGESKESNDGTSDAWVQLLNLPPQVHHHHHHGVPVGGMRRVSSCYFSIASNLSGNGGEYHAAALDTASFHSPNPSYHNSSSGHGIHGHYDALSFEGRNASDFLLHDVLMSVFSFLDAQSLASFSETGKRPNFEVFYFLELQLQRALLVGESHQYAARKALDCVDEEEVVDDGGGLDDDGEGAAEGGEGVDDALLPQDEQVEGEAEDEGIGDEEPGVENDKKEGSNAVPSFEGSIAGTGVISRLASLDSTSARRIVQAYLDSNASIHSMPLIHSLAYFRQVLSRQHPNLFPQPRNLPDGMAKNARNMALFFTFLGAAYMRAQQGEGMPMPDPRMMMPDPSEVITEENMEAMKGMMLKLGLAGGFLKAGQTMKEKAEQVSNARHRAASDHEEDWGGMQTVNEENEEGLPVDVQVQGQTDAAGASPNSPTLAAANANSSRRSTSIGSIDDLSQMIPRPAAIASRLYNAFSSGNMTAAATPSSPKTSTANLDAPASSDEDHGQSSDEQPEATSPSRRRHRSKRSHQTLRDLENDDEYAANSEEKKVEPEVKEQKVEGAVPSPEEAAYAMAHPFSPNPYDHQPSFSADTAAGSAGVQYPSHESAAASAAATSFFSFNVKADSPNVADSANVPTGCVGAYAHAVKSAASELTRLIKEERRNNFNSLSPEEQHELAERFIDACTSDSKLHIVKEILQKQRKMDVDKFFIGPDDTETCALHAAAFNGAEAVLKFLCGGIDENDPDKDCGLCDVNVRDANGWTALHFAAGANSVTSVQVLSRHGAELTIEAGNGYTPYHWAERLSNEEVAAELEGLGADNRFVGRWMFARGGSSAAGRGGGDDRRIPFVSFLANRFFAFNR